MGFSGIIAGGGVHLASLEEQEAADKMQPPASGTAIRMKSAPKKSPPMPNFRISSLSHNCLYLDPIMECDSVLWLIWAR